VAIVACKNGKLQVVWYSIVKCRPRTAEVRMQRKFVSLRTYTGVCYISNNIGLIFSDSNVLCSQPFRLNICVACKNRKFQAVWYSIDKYRHYGTLSIKNIMQMMV
jgi:hypothetical protein